MSFLRRLAALKLALEAAEKRLGRRLTATEAAAVQASVSCDPPGRVLRPSTPKE